jgi:hypothetical protein
MLNGIMLDVIMLNVIMLNAIMQSVIMLNVVAPIFFLPQPGPNVTELFTAVKCKCSK